MHPSIHTCPWPFSATFATSQVSVDGATAALLDAAFGLGDASGSGNRSFASCPYLNESACTLTATAAGAPAAPSVLVAAVNPLARARDGAILRLPVGSGNDDDAATRHGGANNNNNNSNNNNNNNNSNNSNNNKGGARSNNSSSKLYHGGNGLAVRVLRADTQQPVASQLLPPWPTNPHQHDWTTFVAAAPTVAYAADVPALGAFVPSQLPLVCCVVRRCMRAIDSRTHAPSVAAGAP
jgi:hypothetical protein